MGSVMHLHRWHSPRKGVRSPCQSRRPFVVRYDCLVNPGRLSMRMLCCALMCNSELTRRVVYATPMQAYAAQSSLYTYKG